MQLFLERLDDGEVGEQADQSGGAGRLAVLGAEGEEGDAQAAAMAVGGGVVQVLALQDAAAFERLLDQRGGRA